jgi:hypothetical protein
MAARRLQRPDPGEYHPRFHAEIMLVPDGVSARVGNVGSGTISVRALF